MPTNPQITNRHPLSRILNPHKPIPIHRILNQPPQPPTSQQPLRRIRPHNARPDSRTYHRLGMIEQESIRRLPPRDAHCASDGSPDGREMPTELTLIIVVAPHHLLQPLRELPQRQRSMRFPRSRLQRPLPQRQQRLPLRHARSPGHRAQGARIEGGVQVLEQLWRCVGGEEIGKRGRGEGCDCEGEEVGESFGCGFGIRGGRVVREVGF